MQIVKITIITKIIKKNVKLLERNIKKFDINLINLNLIYLIKIVRNERRCAKK